RAAVVAERDAAVHAASALDLRVGVGERRDEFLVVLYARERCFVRLMLALELEKTGCLTHMVLVYLIYSVRGTAPAAASLSAQRGLSSWSRRRCGLKRPVLPGSPSSRRFRPVRACIPSGTPSRTGGVPHPSFPAAPSHAASR